jgi:Sec-independent protein translocase protein TatA
MGRSLGESMRGFKDAITDRVDKQDAEATKEQAQLPPAQPPTHSTPATQQSDPRERDTVV